MEISLFGRYDDYILVFRVYGEMSFLRRYAAYILGDLFRACLLMLEVFILFRWMGHKRLRVVEHLSRLFVFYQVSYGRCQGFVRFAQALF